MKNESQISQSIDKEDIFNKAEDIGDKLITKGCFKLQEKEEAAIRKTKQ